jgi:aminomethyltransferase
MSEQTMLAKTPLHAFHLSEGAKMSGFAGYDMPLSYTQGAIAEHHLCRTGAAIFDVSHMGQIELRDNTGSAEAILAQLETIIPANLIGLKAGRQRYGLFLNKDGGILDDLMVANYGTHVRLVVNAACVEQDMAWISGHLTDMSITQLQRALIALQGPSAGAAFAALVPASADMSFMDACSLHWNGVEIEATRSGYTGEDGFEISCSDAVAEDLVRALLAHDNVGCAGLIARDSLRLEAGLCLYGQDMDASTSIVAASLGWAVPKIRRTGGARMGGFIGADRTLAECDAGAVFCRIGAVAPKGVPPRAGTEIYTSETAEAPVGRISSGMPGPSVGQPVTMLQLPHDIAVSELPLFADVRGKRILLSRADMPFFPHRFHR